MRKLIMLAAPLALVACAEPAAEEEAAVVEEVAEVAPAMTSANGSAAGMYNVTAADGSINGSMLNADGTYQDMDADGAVTGEGTWEVADGKTCFTSNEEGAAAECWTESAPGADGSFTATSDAGDVVTVTPAA